MGDRWQRVLEAVVRAADEPVIAADAGSTIAYWNPAAERVLGWTAAEAVGQPLSILWPEGVSPTGKEILESVYRGEQVMRVRTERLHKDGHAVPVLLSVCPVLEDGKFAGSGSILRDLTEQLASEESLRRRDARFDALLRHAFDVAVVLDPQADIQELVVGRERPFGHEPATVVGRSSWDYVHPEDRPLLEEVWQRALTTPGPQPPTEYRIRLADGSWGWAEQVVSNVLHDPAIEALVINIRDITDRRRAEQRQRAIEQSYRRALLSAPEALAVVTADDTITFANPRLAALVGADAEDLVGRRYTDLDLPAPTRRAGVPLPHRRGDGVQRWLEVTSVPLVEGETGDRLLIWRDFTIQVALHDRLVEMERLEALGHFASGVAHDFSNVLLVLRGQAELISRELPPEGQLREDIDALQEGVDRAADLVDQLTAFARGQALRPERVDLTDHLPGLADFCQRLVPDHLTLELVVPEEPLPVDVDPGQLDRVVVNLVRNAVDALGDRQGRIVLAAATGAMPGAPRRPAVVLTVSDDGHGMPAEVRARCFEPFFSTKGPGLGTGLGLPSSQGIVQQSGGTIEVSSVPGEGTVMSIHLPCVGPGQSPRSVGRGRGHDDVLETLDELDVAAGVDGDGDGPTVLVVDDDAAVRGYVAKVLSGAGYRVLVAGDAVEAEEAAADARRKEQPVALLLTDVHMPGERGNDLARRLWDDGAVGASLLMTGFPGQPGFTREEGAELLAKPFTATELLARVRAALDGHDG